MLSSFQSFQLLGHLDQTLIILNLLLVRLQDPRLEKITGVEFHSG